METREVLSASALSNIAGATAVAEGDTYTLALQAGATPVLEWRIDWGDGDLQTLPGSATSATHEYDDGSAQFTISVQAQQDVPFTVFQWSTASGGNGHYYALTSAPSSWTAAEAEAAALGGHLVSIINQAEQTFVQQTFLSGLNDHKIYWIGLSDFQKEGTFVWANGNPFSYTNWQGPNEPNNLNGNEDYVTINWHYANGRVGAKLGSWNDSPLNGINSALTAPEPVRGIMEFNSKPAGALTTHTIQVYVNNVDPTLEVQGPTIAVPGQIVEFTVGASDVSQADIDAGLTIAVDWQSDGVVDQTVTGSSANLSTHFTHPGVYVVTFTVTDKDGGRSLFTQSVMVPTAQQQIDTIAASLMGFVASGALTQDEGNALTSKLDNAGRKLESGDSKTAVNVLNATKNQIRSLVQEGLLPESDGEQLIASINDAIATALIAEPAKPRNLAKK